MSNPNKQEMNQLQSLERQLSRLAGTTDSLYRRMGINGRDPKYVEKARWIAAQLKVLADQVEDLVGEQ